MPDLQVLQALLAEAMHPGSVLSIPSGTRLNLELRSREGGQTAAPLPSAVNPSITYGRNQSSASVTRAPLLVELKSRRFVSSEAT